MPPHQSASDIQSIDFLDLFQACFETSGSIMGISTLEDGRQIDVNEAWLISFGYSRDEVIGKTVDFVNDLSKGDLIFVSGKIKAESWTDKESGDKRFSQYLIAL